MTSKAAGGGRILGSLRSADGKGVVRMEDRFDTDIDAVWSALTDPSRLARWYGRVEGDLRPGGGAARLFHPMAGTAPGTCKSVSPHSGSADDQGDGRGGRNVIEATLAADDHQTILVVEVQGMPLDLIAAYGAGGQIHAENLAAYLAGVSAATRRRGGASSSRPTKPWRPTSARIPLTGPQGDFAHARAPEPAIPSGRRRWIARAIAPQSCPCHVRVRGTFVSPYRSEFLTHVVGSSVLSRRYQPADLDPNRDERDSQERHPGDPHDVPEPGDEPDQGCALGDRLRRW